MTDITSIILSKDQLSEVKNGLQEFVPKRSACKSPITKFSRKLRELHASGGITCKSFQVHKNCIEKALNEVQDWDSKIVEFLSANKVATLDSGILDREIDRQSDYYLETQSFLSELEPADQNNASFNVSQSSESSITKIDAKVPVLQCGNFSGEEDKMEFRTFLVQFNNLIDSKRHLSSSAKLTYLRGYLRGYALKVISYLPINDDNYQNAVKLLKDEFLDIPYLKEQMFKQIVELSPKYDVTYHETRIYINEVRSIIHELGNYGLDFLNEDSAGFSLLSYIIFSNIKYCISFKTTYGK